MTKAILIIIGAGLFGGLGVTSLQLADRVKAQESQMERLRNELQTLREGMPSESPENTAGIAASSFDLPAGATAGSVEGIESDDLRALVAQMVKDEAVVSAIARRVEGQIETGANLFASESFRDGLKGTLEEIREEQRAEQMAERAERMAERTENRAQELADRLKLPADVAEQFTDIIVSNQESMGDVWSLARSGEIERGEVRTIMREQRSETNTAIQELLTPQEYEQYTALSQEMNIFGGGRGRGGFGGGNTNTGGATPASPTSGGNAGSAGAIPQNGGGGTGGGGRGGN